MRYFIGYHNEQKMGYSCADISTPRLKTKKSVEGLEGSTVWLISGEGRTPKKYYVALTFNIEECATGKYPGTKLPNEVSGLGIMMGKSTLINGSQLLSQLKLLSANFVSGFCELRDPSVIASLKAFE